MTVEPVLPDGSNGWYVTAPTVTLTSSEPGITYYSWVSSGPPWVYVLRSHRACCRGEGTSSLWYFSADAGGNKEPVQNATLRFDAGQPSIPGTPTTTPLSTDSISVSWPAATDSVSRSITYEVRANGNLVAVSATNAVTISSLSTETAYSFTVSAVDAAGNVSSESESATAITLAELPRPPMAVYTRAVPIGCVRELGRDHRHGSAGFLSAVALDQRWHVLGDRDIDGRGLALLRGLRPHRPGSPFGTWFSVVDTRGRGPKERRDLRSNDSRVGVPAGGRRRCEEHGLGSGHLGRRRHSPGVIGYHVYRSTLSTDVGTTLTVLPEDQVCGQLHPRHLYRGEHQPHVNGWPRWTPRGRIGKLSAAVYVRTEAGSGTVEAPHGAYNEDTDMCALCHSTHTSTSPFSLLRGTTSDEAPLCFTCHDGTSASDIMGEYTSTSKPSRHAVSVGSVTGTLRCSDCSWCPLSRADRYRQGPPARRHFKVGQRVLLRVSWFKRWERNPRGDLTGFESSSHQNRGVSAANGHQGWCV